MSLINQMLQDLDNRREAEERLALPNEVRSLPPKRHSAASFWMLAAMVTLVATGAYFYLTKSGGFLPELPAVSTPTVSNQTGFLSDSAQGDAQQGLSPAQTSTPSSSEAQLRAPEFVPLRLSDVLSSLPVRYTTPAAPSAAEPKGVAKSSDASPTTVAATTTAPAAVVTTTPVPKGEPKDSAGGRIEKTPLQASGQERAEAEYRRGAGLVSQGQVKEGTDALRQALRFEGTHGGARQLLLRILLEQHSYDEARDLLVEALQLQPGRYQWALALARLQVERNETAAAWQTLQGSMGTGAASSDYQGLSGNVLQRMGNARDAAEHYRAALRISPNDGRWWIGLGMALESAGNVAEARTAFQTARASGSLTSEMAAFVDQRLR